MNLLFGVVSLKRLVEEAEVEEGRRAVIEQLLGSGVLERLVGLVLRDDEPQLKWESV